MNVRVVHDRGQFYQDLDLVEADGRVILVRWPHQCCGWIFLEADHPLFEGNQVSFCQGSTVVTLRVDGRSGPVKGRNLFAWLVTAAEDQWGSVDALPNLGGVTVDES